MSRAYQRPQSGQVENARHLTLDDLIRLAPRHAPMLKRMHRRGTLVALGSAAAETLLKDGVRVFWLNPRVAVALDEREQYKSGIQRLASDYFTISESTPWSRPWDYNMIRARIDNEPRIHMKRAAQRLAKWWQRRAIIQADIRAEAMAARKGVLISDYDMGEVARKVERMVG